MTWRVAKSLEKLLEQVNAAAPIRRKDSDGTKGDDAHALRTSDHNPDAKGIVRALDITHDPKGGVDSERLADTLRLSHDPRIKYIISNRKIAAGYAVHGEAAWTWRPYAGENPHDHHCHISVVADDALADDVKPWPIDAAFGAAPSLLRTPAAVKMRMGKAITLAEARRENGHLAVYHLPANDGGGSYEVAGINDRYHPVEAAKLKTMIEAGRYQEAEDFVGEFTAAYTDVADLWTSSWGIEFYLRDCVFNRGPTGAAKILQRALIIRGDSIGPDGVDGDIGGNTMAAIGRQESNVDAMLIALRQAREDYEREDVGVRANLWNGLINRFNSALNLARQFQTEQPKETPVTDETTNDQVIKAIDGLRSDIAQLTPLFAALVSALKGAAPVPVPVAEPKPAPVLAPPVPVPAPVPAPSTTSVLQQPGVGIGTLGLVLTGVLQALGVMGPTTGEAATTAGQLLPILSAGTAALGATGTFGSILNAVMTVGSMIFQGTQKK